MLKNTIVVTFRYESASSDWPDHKTITASKKYETKNITTSEFNAISTSSSVNVIYTQATGEPSVEIYAPDNVIDYISVEVKGKTLVVGMTKNIRIKGQHKKEVHVSAPAVDNLKASSSGDIILKNGLTATGKIGMKASSSGDIKSNDNISCTTLTLSASSSGNIELKNISCTDLSAQASSSGDIDLSGKCENATYKVSSAGDIKGRNLFVRRYRPLGRMRKCNLQSIEFRRYKSKKLESHKCKSRNLFVRRYQLSCIGQTLR